MPRPFFTPNAPMERHARMHDGVPAQLRSIPKPVLVNPPAYDDMPPEPAYLAEILDGDACLFEP
jgi:hypothetical protein